MKVRLKRGYWNEWDGYPKTCGFVAELAGFTICDEGLSGWFNVPKKVNTIDIYVTTEPMNKQSVCIKYKTSPNCDLYMKTNRGLFEAVGSSARLDHIFVEKFGENKEVWATVYY